MAEEQIITDANNQEIRKDDSGVKDKVLVGNPIEGFRWVDQSEYSFTGVEEGLPVSSSGITSSLPGQPAYIPPRDPVFGPNVPLQRAQKVALEDPDAATRMFSSPEIIAQVEEAEKQRLQRLETAEEFLETITSKKDYDLFLPEEIPENFLKDENGEIKYKTVIIEHPWKGTKTAVKEPLFKRVTFRHYLGSAGTSELGSPEKGETVVLEGITKSEAIRASHLYTDIMKRRGTTKPVWATGRWWERIPGYTAEGPLGFMKHPKSGETASFMELLFGTPILGDVAAGVAAIPRLITDTGTVSALTWAMNKEKEFTDWIRTGGDEEEYFHEQEVLNKQYLWSRNVSARQIKYMLDKPEAEGLDLYVHLLGENVAFTLGALRATRFLGKSKTFYADINNEVFENYRKEIVARLKKAGIKPTQKRIDKEMDKISATEFHLDANKLIRNKILPNYAGENARSVDKLRLAYNNAKYKVGANPGLFSRDVGVTELTFGGGQYLGIDLWGDDEMFGQLALGLGFAVLTPGALDSAIRTGQWLGLKAIDVVDQAHTLIGMDWQFGQKLIQSIEGTGDSAFLQSMLVNGEINKKQYQSGLKFFQALSQMPDNFRQNAIASFKRTQKVKGELESYVRSLTSVGVDGTALQKGQGLADSKFGQQFEVDPSLPDEVNIKNVIDDFNVTLGATLDIKLLSLAEAKLMDQAQAGMTLDYNFLMQAKMAEDKFKAASKLNRLLDTLGASFPKNLISDDLQAFLKEATTQVNSVYAETAENIKILKNTVGYQLGAEFSSKSRDLARLDHLIDGYHDLRLLELEVDGKPITTEDINRIRKEASNEKYIIRRNIIADEMKNSHAGPANRFTASENSAVHYVQSWEDVKSIGGRKYKDALEDVDVVSEDAYPLLKELVEEAKATPSEVFIGASADDVGTVLNNIIDPLVNKELDKFYSQFVGKEIEGIEGGFKNVDEVRNYFEEEYLSAFGSLNGLEKFESIQNSLPAFADEMGIAIDDFGLKLTMDDLDHLIQGLNSRIFNGIANSNILTRSNPESMAQVRKLNAIKGRLDSELAEGENIIKTEYKANWKNYKLAKEFWKNNVSPVLYNNDITDWVMKLNSPTRKKITPKNRTQYDHANSLSGKGNKDGFLDYVWKSLQDDPDKAMENINKTFGVWDGTNFVPVTDDMIRQAEIGPTGQGAGRYLGYTAAELKTIKLRRETFGANLNDYYVARFQDGLAKAGEKAGIPSRELRKLKDGSVDYDYYISVLDDVRKGVVDPKTNLAKMALIAQRDLFKEAHMIDNLNTDIFNSKRALQLRKKLEAADLTDTKIAKKLYDADTALKNSKNSLTDVETIIAHQELIQGAVQNITGKSVNVDQLFNHLILEAAGEDRIKALEDFLVHGKVSEELRMPTGSAGTTTVGKGYTTMTGGQLSQKQFDDAMSKILAAGIRRASTTEIRVGSPTGVGRLDLGTNAIGTRMETTVDYIKMMSILKENEKALAPYVNVKAMEVIGAMGQIMDPGSISSIGVSIANPQAGLARFTPASWISRFYAAQSGRTSYRYIGAEALVAALLRNKHNVTLALLENKGAQEALANMLISGKVPSKIIGSPAYAWLPNLVARTDQLSMGIGETMYTTVIGGKPEDEQMEDLGIVN